MKHFLTFVLSMFIVGAINAQGSQNNNPQQNWFDGYIDNDYGYSINNIAPNGHCLIGNGTYYVDSGVSCNFSASGNVEPATQFSIYGQIGTGTRAVASAIPGLTADTSGNLSAASVNTVVSPCSFAGATADVKLQAAIDSITAGTIDARCFGATNQTIAATVTWGWTADSTGPKTLLFDPATTFTPGSTTLTMFNPGRWGYWKHLHIHLGALASTYAGIVILYSNDWYGATAGGTIPDTLASNYNGDGLRIDDGYGNSLYTAIAMEPGSNAAVDFLHFNNINNTGGLSTILMNTTGTGWINSNTFTNLIDACTSGTHATWRVIANGTGNLGADAQISGNLVDGVGYEANGGSGCETWDISGESLTGGDGKVFVNTNNLKNYIAWDNSNLQQFVDHIGISGSGYSYRNVVEGLTDPLDWTQWLGPGDSFIDPFGDWSTYNAPLKFAANNLRESAMHSSFVDINPNLGTNYWAKIGTWSGATYQNPLLLVLQTADGAYGGNNRGGLSLLEIQSGNPGSAGSGPPNLSSMVSYGLGSSDIVAVQAVQTGCGLGCTPSATNSSWDIYVEVLPYSNLNAFIYGDPTAAWTYSGTVLSGCSTLPSTCLSTPAGGFLTGSVFNLAGNNGYVYSPHFMSTGTPAIACGTGAGTSPTVCSIAGNDETGQISVTTGTAPTNAGTIATITLHNACPNSVYAVVSGSNTAAASLSGTTHEYPDGFTASSWTLTANTTSLAASTAYTWSYIARCN